jgi:hypothetical protein
MTRDEWKLVHGAIRADNLPSRSGHKPPHLRKDVSPIERLRRSAAGMPHGGIKLIQTHEVQIVRRSEVKDAARLTYAVHLAHPAARGSGTCSIVSQEMTMSKDPASKGRFCASACT